MGQSLGLIAAVAPSANGKIVERAVLDWSELYENLDGDSASKAATTAPPSRRLGLHNTHTATPFLPVQHPLTALPHPGRTTSYL